MRKHTHRIPDIVNLSTKVVPEGGSTGEVLTKTSDEDHELEWTSSSVSAHTLDSHDTTVTGTQLNTIYTDSHTHSNKTTLDNTSASFTTTLETKLSGVEEGATANDTDANLKARVNHTGTQAISTVTDLQTTLDGKASTTHNHNSSYLSLTEDDVSDLLWTLDEDDMASNSMTKVPTQQSVKAYVDNNTGISTFSSTQLFDGSVTPASNGDTIDWSSGGSGYDTYDYVEVIYRASGLATAINNPFTQWINTSHITTTTSEHMLPGTHNDGASAYIRPRLLFDTTSKTDCEVISGASTGDDVEILEVNGITL